MKTTTTPKPSLKPAIVLAVLATLGALALGSATTAHAGIGPTGSFGTFGMARSIAVDPNGGDVYVADTGDVRIEKYDATGNFILMFGGHVNATKVKEAEEGKPVTEAEENVCTAASGDECQNGTEGIELPSEPFGVAVDPSTGDVYVIAFGDNGILKFSSTGGYISEIASNVGGGATLLASESVNVAVDPAGDIYAPGEVDGVGAIIELSPSGAYTGVDYPLSGGAPWYDVVSVGVDPNGYLYTSGYFAGGGLEVAKYELSGKEVGVLANPGGEALTHSVLGVDPFTGDVFVGSSPSGSTGEAGKVNEYSPAGTPGAQLPVPLAPTALAYGVKAGSLYVLENREKVTIYGPYQVPPLTPGAPQVVSGYSSGLGSASAKIAALVNPEQLDTTYSFQYAANPAFTGAVSVPVTPGDIGSGYLPVPVAAELSDLQGDTAYYYRVVAHNSFGGGGGTTVTGAAQTFTTRPTFPSVSTGGVSEVTYRTATVTGTVVPEGSGLASDTRWCFQYGTVESGQYNLGSLPLLPGDAGVGNGPVAVSVKLTNLEPGATYRYRLVAVNALGTGFGSSIACGTEGGQESDGAEATLTTPAMLPAPQATTGAATGVSQNTATIAGTVDPQGTRTSYEFQLGLDTSYGSQVYGEAGEGSEPETLALALEALQPETTYHYRIVAISAGGTIYGADETFTTTGYPTESLTPPGSAPLIPVPVFAFPAQVPETTMVAKTAVKKAKQKVRKKKRAAKGRKASTHRHAGTRRKG